MVTYRKIVVQKFAALFAFLAMASVNLSAIVIPILRLKPAGIFNAFPILIQPVRPTFLIMGLIWLLLAFYAVWQLASQKAPAALIRKINTWFIIMCAFRIAWTIAWHKKDTIITMLLMIFVLICVIVIIRYISAEDAALTLREKFFIKLPFFVFFAWITVTTAANAAALLVSIGVDSYAPVSEEITIVVLAAGTILGMWTGIQFKSTAYILVYIWMYAGVLCRYARPQGADMLYSRLFNVVLACLVLLTLALAVEIINKIRNKKEK